MDKQRITRDESFIGETQTETVNTLHALKGIPLTIHPIKKIEQVPNKPEQPIDAQKLTKEIIEIEAGLRAMGHKPKSEDKPKDRIKFRDHRELLKGSTSHCPEQPNTELGKDMTLIRD